MSRKVTLGVSHSPRMEHGFFIVYPHPHTPNTSKVFCCFVPCYSMNFLKPVSIRIPTCLLFFLHLSLCKKSLNSSLWDTFLWSTIRMPGYHFFCVFLFIQYSFIELIFSEWMFHKVTEMVSHHLVSLYCRAPDCSVKGWRFKPQTSQHSGNVLPLLWQLQLVRHFSILG